MKLLFLILMILLAGDCGFGQRNEIDRGKYLAEQAAECQRCHTRRLVTGQLDRSVWLKGAILRVRDNPAGPRIIAAPDITAGGPFWRQWARPGMVRFLATGRTPDEKPLNAMMPHYRLRRDDAEAITAYLGSLQ